MNNATGDGTFLSNFIPQNFLPSPRLSKEEDWKKMTASVKVSLQKLGIPISDQTLTKEDRTRLNNKCHHRTLIDSQVTPADAKEVEQFDQAEALTYADPGYFHPGMPEGRQRQLAAIISVSTPQIANQNTPGIASTSTASFLC